MPLFKFSVIGGTPYCETQQSGMTLTVHFFGDCETTIYKADILNGFKEIIIIQAGKLNEGPLSCLTKSEALCEKTGGVVA